MIYIIIYIIGLILTPIIIGWCDNTTLDSDDDTYRTIAGLSLIWPIVLFFVTLFGVWMGTGIVYKYLTLLGVKAYNKFNN